MPPVKVCLHLKPFSGTFNLLDAGTAMLYNLKKHRANTQKRLEYLMSEDNMTRRPPISVVRFGMGKEIQLYEKELVVTSQEEDEDIQIQLEAIKCLTLIPGDPNPSKLVLMADLDDDTTIIVAEGMSNARDFRAMIPLLLQQQPEIQLDPPDMAEQLRQALNTRRAWTLTCYGTFLLVCILLYALYLLVAFLGSHHL
jgi:hypothetical protein